MSDIHADALTLAGAAIATALIDTLHSKGVLDLTEARGVLDSAMRRIGIHATTPEGTQASRLIGEMLRTRFSARND